MTFDLHMGTEFWPHPQGHPILTLGGPLSHIFCFVDRAGGLWWLKAVFVGGHLRTGRLWGLASSHFFLRQPGTLTQLAWPGRLGSCQVSNSYTVPGELLDLRPLPSRG